jgi:hypothetical protein
MHTTVLQCHTVRTSFGTSVASAPTCAHIDFLANFEAKLSKRRFFLSSSPLSSASLPLSRFLFFCGKIKGKLKHNSIMQ